jgi:hypothetical protein
VHPTPFVLISEIDRPDEISKKVLKKPGLGEVKVLSFGPTWYLIVACFGI